MTIAGGLHYVVLFSAYAVLWFLCLFCLLPIGLGSGICGTIAARDALGLRTEVIGVVAEKAAAYALSYAAGKPVATNDADTIADGLAVRVPDPAAVATILKGAARIVSVGEDEILAAMRICHSDTHNTAEPAAAAAVAALLKESRTMAGKRVAAILSGANVDATLAGAAAGAR